MENDNGHWEGQVEAIAYRLAEEQALNWSGCDSTSPAFLFMEEYVKRV